MAWTDGLKERTPRLHKFLTRPDRPFPMIRELLTGALVILLLLGGLYAATGQPLNGGYPVVVVTSGSMMHCKNADTDGVGPQLGRDCDSTRYGRLGFIDPGDLVFVRHVSVPGDVTTLANDGSTHYGKSGDVIVYRPNGSERVTPIIHRALFWLQVEADGTYSVSELGISHVKTLDQASLQALTHCALPTSSGPHQAIPAESGFITKGDNNMAADQCHDWQLSHAVRMEWVLGKARAELPWVGLIKLLVDDVRSGSMNYHNAGSDSKTMLFVSLGIIIVLPWTLDSVRRRKSRKSDGPQT